MSSDTNALSVHIGTKRTHTAIESLPDDPCNDIVEGLVKKTGISNTLGRVASQFTKLDLSRFAIELYNYDIMPELLGTFSRVKYLTIKHFRYKDVILANQNVREPSFSLPRLDEIKPIADNGNYRVTKNIGGGFTCVRSLQNLHSLDLSGSIGITDEDLKSIAKLQSLKVLNLSGCWQITDLGLSYLENLENLSSLNLRHCRKITCESIKFKNLQRLVLDGNFIFMLSDRARDACSAIESLQHLDFYVSGQPPGFTLTGRPLNADDYTRIVELHLGLRSLENPDEIKYLSETYGMPAEQFTQIATRVKSVKVTAIDDKTYKLGLSF